MTSIDHAKTFFSVQDYIDDLNKDNEFCKLADATHFAQYGIRSPEALEEYLFWGSFSDIYKDRNGIRPRWITDRLEAERILLSFSEEKMDELSGKLAELLS